MCSSRSNKTKDNAAIDGSEVGTTKTAHTWQCVKSNTIMYAETIRGTHSVCTNVAAWYTTCHRRTERCFLFISGAHTLKLCTPFPCLGFFQIYSASTSKVDITGSTFHSMVAGSKGGAVYAGGSETLTITTSVFRRNEVVAKDQSAGGDVWANRDVELKVVDSTFSGSAAGYGGAAIVCCGAEILNSNFSRTSAGRREVSLSVC